MRYDCRVNDTELDIRCCDCIKGMQSLKDESVHLCITSPPYNLGIDYNKYNDRQERADYLKWTRQWVAQIRRILTNDGSFFLNVGGSPSNPMLPHEILFEIKD